MKLRGIYALMLLPASLPNALAAQWSFQPAVDWRMDHHSNRQLTVESEPGESAWMTLSANLQHSTNRSQLSLRPRFTVQRFADESQLNTEEGGARFTGTWLSEYSQLTLTAGAEQTSTLTSELESTGIVDARVEREDRSIGLAWDRRLTPYWSFNGQLSAQDIEYPGGLRFGLVGYRYPSAAFSLSAQVSQHLALSATAFGGELTAPLTQAESRNSGARLGAQWAFSPRMQAAFSGGLSTTNIETLFGARRERGQVWSADMSYTGEHQRLSLSWMRNDAASGRGVLSRRDEAKADITHDFSSRLSATLRLRRVLNDDVLPGPLQDERYNYLAAEAGLTHRLSKFWALSVDGGVRQARWAQTDQATRGWYGMFGLRWTPAAHAVSR